MAEIILLLKRKDTLFYFPISAMFKKNKDCKMANSMDPARLGQSDQLERSRQRLACPEGLYTGPILKGSKHNQRHKQHHYLTCNVGGTKTDQTWLFKLSSYSTKRIIFYLILITNKNIRDMPTKLFL